MKKYYFILVISFVISLNKIGIQPWCTEDNNEQIECNYESKEACETYRMSDEKCIPNPDYLPPVDN
jgi:hypothetical protein